MKLSSQLKKEKEKYIQSQFNEAIKLCKLKKYKTYGYIQIEDIILEFNHGYNHRNDKLVTELRFAPIFLDEIFWKVFKTEKEMEGLRYYHRFWNWDSLGTTSMDYIVDLVNDNTNYIELFQNNINELLLRNRKDIILFVKPYQYIVKVLDIMYETNYSPYFTNILLSLVQTKHYRVAYQLAKWQVNNGIIGERAKSFSNGIEKGIYEYTIDFCKEHMKENIDLKFQNSLSFDDVLINESKIEFVLLENEERINEDVYWNQFKKRLNEYFRYIVTGQIIAIKEDFSLYEIKIQLYFQHTLSQIRADELKRIKNCMRNNHSITLKWDIRN